MINSTPFCFLNFFFTKKKFSGKYVSLFVVTTSFCINSVAQKSLLDRMPSPEQVFAKIEAENPYKTAAKRYSALLQLRNIARTITEMQGKSNTDPQLASLTRIYENRMDQIDRDVKPYKPKGELFAWQSERLKLEYDANLRKELFRLFLSESIGEQIDKYEADVFERRRSNEEKIKEERIKKTVANYRYTQLISLLAGLYFTELLLIFLLSRSIRKNSKPISLDEKNPTILKSGNKIYRIGYYTGVVFDSKSLIIQQTTTQVRVNEYNQRSVTTSHSADYHESSVCIAMTEKNVLWIS